MIGVLALIKGLSWQTWLCVAVLVGGAFVYIEKTAHIDLLEHDLSTMTAKRDALQKEIDGAKALAVKTQAEYETKERQTAADQKEIADESQRMSIHARDDGAAASTALAGLLKRAASSGQASANPSTSTASAPDEGTGLRTDLFSSLGAEAIRYAAIADEARIRGSECAGDYDAVVPLEGGP